MIFASKSWFVRQIVMLHRNVFERSVPSPTVGRQAAGSTRARLIASSGAVWGTIVTGFSTTPFVKCSATQCQIRFASIRYRRDCLFSGFRIPRASVGQLPLPKCIVSAPVSRRRIEFPSSSCSFPLLSQRWQLAAFPSRTVRRWRISRPVCSSCDSNQTTGKIECLDSKS